MQRPKIEIKCVQNPQVSSNDQETNEKFEKIESLWNMLNQARQLIWTIKEWKLNLLLDFVAWRRN